MEEDIHKKRWTIETFPYPYERPKYKEVIHPIPTTYDDLPEDQKVVVTHIKNIIISHMGECKMQLFGSRIKGTWNDESDYDIIVSTTPSKEIVNILRKYDYGVPVDIMFATVKNYISNKNIEI